MRGGLTLVVGAWLAVCNGMPDRKNKILVKDVCMPPFVRPVIQLGCHSTHVIAICDAMLGSSKPNCHKGSHMKPPHCCFSDDGPICKSPRDAALLSSRCAGRSTCQFTLTATVLSLIACDRNVRWDFLRIFYACVKPSMNVTSCDARPMTSLTTRPPATTTHMSPPIGHELGGDSGLSAGTIVGIVLGVLILLVLSALLYVFISRKRTLSQRHMTSFKTTFAMAQRMVGNKADYSSNKDICVIASKENDPEYQDSTDTYAEVGDVSGHVNYVYHSAEGTPTQPKASVLSSRRRPLPNAPVESDQTDEATENRLDVIRTPTDVDVNLLANINTKAYSPKLMLTSKNDESEVSKTALGPKASTTSEEDNTAALDSLRIPTPDSPTSPPSISATPVSTEEIKLEQPKPVRSHPPLQRHANFNYKPPEFTKSGRRAPIPAVKEEDENCTNTSGYEKVWVSEKPKLRRGARTSDAGKTETNWGQLRQE